VQGENTDKSAVKHGAIIAADYIEMGNTKLVATTSNGNRIDFWHASNYQHSDQTSTSNI
jgi:hypothetical protein